MEEVEFHDAIESRAEDPLRLSSSSITEEAPVFVEAETTGLQLPEGVTGVPRLKVDLDEKAEERWAAVIAYFRQDITALRAVIKEEVREIAGPQAAKFLDSLGAVLAPLTTLINRKLVYYGRELAGVAKHAGVPLHEVLLIQFAYEAASCCTSVVLPEPLDTFVHHFRTMDWEMDIMKKTSVEVEFWKDGSLLFISSAWPAYVGVLTGMRPGAFSVSVNFRTTGEGYLKNLRNAAGMAWPIGFLVRAALETCLTYNEAVRVLAESQLIAPVYFSVAGVANSDGCIVTRDRDKEIQRWTVRERGFSVQPNMEHWSNDPYDDILMSMDRRALARERVLELLAVQAHTGEPLDVEELWKILSEYPINNSLTVSGTYMCAAKGHMQTRICNGEAGFLPCANPLPFGGCERVACSSCGVTYAPELNPAGMCAHKGSWHAKFGDCNYLRCGKGLGVSNLGLQHWSCCYSTEPARSGCPKSTHHTQQA